MLSHISCKQYGSGVDWRILPRCVTELDADLGRRKGDRSVVRTKVKPKPGGGGLGLGAAIQKAQLHSRIHSRTLALVRNPSRAADVC